MVPQSGLTEINIAQLASTFGPTGTDQPIVSIDWITHCLEEDQQVELDPYRITLPAVIPTADVKVEVDTGLMTSSAPAAVRHAETSAQRAHMASPHVEARPSLSTVPPGVTRATNATAESIGRTAPRDVIKIEDDDDDDCIMIETLPLPKARATSLVSTAKYPSPPRTPFEDNADALQRLANMPKISLGSLAPDSDDDDEEDEESPSQNSRAQYQHDPLSATGPPPIITDPAEREHMMQTFVQAN